MPTDDYGQPRDWDSLGITKPANGPIPKRVAREALRVLIMPHLKPLVEAQVALALGVKYLVKRGPNGKIVRASASDIDAGEVFDVWTEPPSTAAFIDLMNRAIDKPKEQEQDINVNAIHSVSFGGRYKPREDE